uniref:Uncharacterized protein n=1 Tax=Arundo donax TaxID=35708 RepID=A0A0A8YKB9_ARUDO
MTLAPPTATYNPKQKIPKHASKLSNMTKFGTLMISGTEAAVLYPEVNHL